MSCDKTKGTGRMGQTWYFGRDTDREYKTTVENMSCFKRRGN